MTVGSSPSTSSPTSALAIACRMPGEGRVTVSLRRSTIPILLLPLVRVLTGLRRDAIDFFALQLLVRLLKKLLVLLVADFADLADGSIDVVLKHFVIRAELFEHDIDGRRIDFFESLERVNPQRILIGGDEFQ